MRALFRDVIPALLVHRLAPLALCNATVVSEFRRLASRLRLLDDGVVPRALLASRAGEQMVFGRLPHDTATGERIVTIAFRVWSSILCDVLTAIHGILCVVMWLACNASCPHN